MCLTHFDHFGFNTTLTFFDIKATFERITSPFFWFNVIQLLGMIGNARVLYFTSVIRFLVLLMFHFQDFIWLYHFRIYFCLSRAVSVNDCQISKVSGFKSFVDRHFFMQNKYQKFFSQSTTFFNLVFEIIGNIAQEQLVFLNFLK